MDNLKSRGARAFVWDFTGKFVRTGMVFVTSIILARLLDPSDFGLIAIVLVVTSLAQVFAGIGLGGALIQRKRALPIHYSSVFYFNLLLSFCLCLIVFISASLIADFYSNSALRPLIELASVTFVLNSLSSIPNIYLTKKLNHAILTKANLISSFLSGALAILLAYLGYGVWSLIVQVLAHSIIYNVIIWTKTTWRPTFQFSFKALKQLWVFGFRMFLVQLIETIYTKLDYLIIGKLFPLATLGYFQRAKSLNLMAIQNFSGSLMSVLFPVLSSIQNNLPRFQNIILKAFGIICFSVFILYGNLFLVAEEIIVILFSEKWLPSAEYFRLLTLSGFAFPINALLVNILSSRGNSKAFLRMTIYKKAIAFSNLGVVITFGIIEFLWGLLVVAILNTYITIFMSSKEIKMNVYVFIKPVLVQLLIAISCIIATLYITELTRLNVYYSIIIKTSTFTFLYLIINWILKTASLGYFLEIFKPMLYKYLDTIRLRFINKT